MFSSENLYMRELEASDASFILELLNTQGFLSFIGDRQVRNLSDSLRYIQTVKENETISYWVVNLNHTDQAIGIVSMIKREYLAFHDIGFAFLPRYSGMGYAREASHAMLEHVIDQCHDQRIFATVMPENINSIKLLQRLGLRFEAVLEEKNDSSSEILHVYSIMRDELLINRLSRNYFKLFSNRHGATPKFDDLVAMCQPSVLFNNKIGERFKATNLEQFIRPRQQILTNGYLSDFEEFELSSTTSIVGNIAQRQCVYGKRGVLDGRAFQQQGDKLIQFIKEDGQWKINSALWEDHVTHT